VKVLFQSRSTLFTVPGGDTIQVLKTKEYLERLGVFVAISNDLEPDVSSYDIVHLFNLVRPQEVYLQALNAKRQNKKVALSTIYVSYEEYERYVRGGVLGLLSRFLGPGKVEYLKIAARAAINREIYKAAAISGEILTLQWIIGMSDVFLPNSESEMLRLRTDIPFPPGKRYTVVPNAVDKELFLPEGGTVSHQTSRFAGCVLCVARIEGLKNQLNLVRAMRDLPWPLVLIGKPAPNHLRYFASVKRDAGPNVHLLGEIPHDQLPRYYRAAKVHALASWMETTGLSSLEAGAMGCNVVITDKGDTREYFGSDAFYCDPGSIESIRAALVKAYEAPVAPVLRERILRQYTWERTAEKTLEGYSLALSS
jgi:glycosyltransferase involved in cell wall biosynthesis